MFKYFDLLEQHEITPQPLRFLLKGLEDGMEPTALADFLTMARTHAYARGTYARTHTHSHIRTRAYARAHTHAHIRTRTYARAHTHAQQEHGVRDVCACACARVCVCVTVS